MERKKLFLAILAITLLVGVASAAVISYFGKVQMTATVKQAVLLDGKDYEQMPITEEVEVAGGEQFCSCHWLQSQTSVPVNLEFETSITYDGGITVEYYKYSELSLSAGDFNYRDPAVPYVKLFSLKYVDGCFVWTIDLNGSLISGHWSTGAQVLVVTPSKIFTLGISPGVGGNVYKEFVGGTWSEPMTPPEGMETVGEPNDEHFEIKIPVEYLCGGKWAINIEASWPEHSGSYWARYPTTWEGWYDFTNLADFPVEQITSPFTLAPGERLDFIICYKFAVNIKPGTYTITTTVKPVS